MSSVEVNLRGNVIDAVYSGAMTMSLVKEAQAKIEAFLRVVPHPVILYDTLAMDPPPMALAMEMKAFDARVQPRILRSATVVKDAMTAFMAKIAFAFSRDHRVFYDDRDGALRWLMDAVQTAQKRSASV